jgi:hypothetical protein
MRATPTGNNSFDKIQATLSSRMMLADEEPMQSRNTKKQRKAAKEWQMEDVKFCYEKNS